MLIAIILTIACIIAAITFGHIVIGANRDFDGHTAIGWWIVGIGIIQLFCIAPLAMWWPEWWIAHRVILEISSYIACACLLLWGIVEIGRRL